MAEKEKRKLPTIDEERELIQIYPKADKDKSPKKVHKTKKQILSPKKPQPEGTKPQPEEAKPPKTIPNEVDAEKSLHKSRKRDDEKSRKKSRKHEEDGSTRRSRRPEEAKSPQKSKKNEDKGKEISKKPEENKMSKPKVETISKQILRTPVKPKLSEEVPSMRGVDISRSPVQCPIQNCQRTIGAAAILAHYLHDHRDVFGGQFEEIYAEKRVIMTFSPTTFEFRNTVGMGVMCYGGIENESETLPAVRGICMTNGFLLKTEQNLAGYLPIMIMGCLTSWSAMIEDKETAALFTDPEDVQQHVFIIWLVSPQTTKPIFATLTVFDREMSVSRSTIIKPRPITESQDPCTFLNRDTSYMMLNSGDLELLTHDKTECVLLEIVIREYV